LKLRVKWQFRTLVSRTYFWPVDILTRSLQGSLIAAEVRRMLLIGLSACATEVRRARIADAFLNNEDGAPSDLGCDRKTCQLTGSSCAVIDLASPFALSSAISIGPSENSPFSALRVRSRR
jgi:hypothetical protein